MNNWDKIEHDFGNMKVGQSYTTVFTYTGRKEIERVKATCGCTVTKLDGNTVKATLTGKRAGTNYNKPISVFFKETGDPTSKGMYDVLRVKGTVVG